MTTVRDPSPERAQEIQKQLDTAVTAAVECLRALREAASLSEFDYEHNDEHLRNMVGVAAILAGQINVEHGTWSGYAAARLRR